MIFREFLKALQMALGGSKPRELLRGGRNWTYIQTLAAPKSLQLAESLQCGRIESTHWISSIRISDFEWPRIAITSKRSATFDPGRGWKFI